MSTPRILVAVVVGASVLSPAPTVAQRAWPVPNPDPEAIWLHPIMPAQSQVNTWINEVNNRSWGQTGNRHCTATTRNYVLDALRTDTYHFADSVPTSQGGKPSWGEYLQGHNVIILSNIPLSRQLGSIIHEAMHHGGYDTTETQADSVVQCLQGANEDDDDSGGGGHVTNINVGGSSGFGGLSPTAVCSESADCLTIGIPVGETDKLCLHFYDDNDVWQSSECDSEDLDGDGFYEVTICNTTLSCEIMNNNEEDDDGD